MIDFPSQQELAELQAFDYPYCLTIYAPFIEPNAATNPNRIELKNLLQEARTALLSAGVAEKDVRKTLRPAKLLIDSREFWPIHNQGLALFMHPRLFRYYHIPAQETPYMLSVERGFNLEPLLIAMKDDSHYFVLVLSHKNVHLYEGDRYQLKALHLKDFPTDMKTELRIDENPKWRETHKIAPPSAGKGSEAVHGQYNVSQVDKRLLLQFFRRIDKRLHRFLLDSQSPLILAGVGYLLPIYRQINTYPRLAKGGIRGNLDRTDIDTIRDRALSLISGKEKQHENRTASINL